MKCPKKVFGTKCGALFGFQLCVLFTFAGGTVLAYKRKLYGNTLPFLNVAITYFLVLICNLWRWDKSESKWWGYILVAIFIIGADCLNLLGYNKTSIASVMLLVSTEIFWVAPLSFLVFKRKINWIQFLAMILGAGGVALIIVAQGIKGSHLIGNIIAIGASIFYAIVNVTQEKIVKDDTIGLYLCRFSCAAAPLAAILSGSLEYKTIKEYKWEFWSIFFHVIYPIILAGYYMFMPIVLQYSNATVMILSFLTTNFYSLAIDMCLFGKPFSWLYLAGFLCIPVAVAIFVLCETK